MDDGARSAARLTVLASPSGAGTDSVVELIRARSPWVWVPVPVTTRAKRGHEVDGVHHVFVGRAEFERMIAGGELLEWAQLAGNLYGTPRDPVEAHLRAGQPVLVKLDPAGARQVRTALPEAQLILLVPSGADRPRAIECEFDVTVVNDHRERAAEELVDLLGSSFLTPAQPRASG